MLVLTFQSGSDCLALEVRRVREVVPSVRLQAVECSPRWLAGVFIYRGQVVPVIDLSRLLGAAEHPANLSTRIILVAHNFDGQERLVGLLAAEVADIREMQETRDKSLFREKASEGLFSGKLLVEGREIVQLVELDRLLPELNEHKLALVPRELPA
jgi:chemotaxis-related protein WspB